MAWQFLTVPEELLEHAECVANHFRDTGYTVRAEPAEIGYPYAPTLQCRIGRKTVLLELDSTIPYQRLRDWSGYARSCNRDTRVALALPRSAPHTSDDETRLRNERIGLYLSDGKVVEEIIIPHDLALNVQLPELAKLHPKIRKVLGPVYEQFNHSHWREGFDEGCQAVANEAAKYLQDGMKAGRIAFVSQAGKPLKYTPKRIEKLTLGQLATAFGQIAHQNGTDAKIAKVLKRINPDRVRVAHYKRKAAAEARLRKNVGQHMWSVVDALKELLGIK